MSKSASDIAGYCQTDNATGTDFSRPVRAVIQELKREVISGKISSDCSENVRPINNFVVVVVNEKYRVAAHVCCQIISYANQQIGSGINGLAKRSNYLEVNSTRVRIVVS